MSIGGSDSGHVYWRDPSGNAEYVDWIEMWARDQVEDGSAPAVAGRSCRAIKDQAPWTIDRTYWIDPDGVGGIDGFEAYCDMTTDGGGWMLLARNTDTTHFELFDQSWDTYKAGFGDTAHNGDGWIGNEAMHWITAQGPTTLEVRNDVRVHEYRDFNLFDEADDYMMTVGESPNSEDNGMFRQYHSGFPFSTFDRDNDLHNDNCGQTMKMGWWYQACYWMTIAGNASDQVYWRDPNGAGEFVDWIEMWAREDTADGSMATTAGLDCQKIKEAVPAATDGTYWIDPDGPGGYGAFEAYCDMTTSGGGWTLLAGNTDTTHFNFFDRPWAEYKAGFGNTAHNNDGWIGNDAIHLLTTQGPTVLEVRNDVRVHEYRDFNVLDETMDYLMTFGDSPNSADFGAFAHHSGRAFSTFDRDNDYASSNCAVSYLTGWWYWDCYALSFSGSNLGQVYWRTPDNTLEYVDWIEMWVRGVPPDGSSPTSAAQSCREIKNAVPSASDGSYWIDPDAPGGEDAFQAYCDMTTDGGGWTLCLNSRYTEDAAHLFTDTYAVIPSNGDIYGYYDWCSQDHDEYVVTLADQVSDLYALHTATLKLTDVEPWTVASPEWHNVGVTAPNSSAVWINLDPTISDWVHTTFVDSPVNLSFWEYIDPTNRNLNGYKRGHINIGAGQNMFVMGTGCNYSSCTNPPTWESTQSPAGWHWRLVADVGTGTYLGGWTEEMPRSGERTQVYYR